MNKFTVGEEVRYDGEVYVISALRPGPPVRYRLLATRPTGTRFVIAEESELEEMRNYLKARADTESF